MEEPSTAAAARGAGSSKAQVKSDLGKRKCPSCRPKMGEDCKKVLCARCITTLVREESATVCDDLVTSVRKEIQSTIQSFRDSLQPSTSQAAASESSQASLQGESMSQETPREDVPLAEGASEDEDLEAIESVPTKFKLSLEEVDGLLKAIHATLGLEEEKRELSLHDRMYAGLGETRGRMFPVHQTISEAIKKEWQDPEKKPFLASAHKRRFPFEEDPAEVWNKMPKLDAAFSQVSRSTDLAFEDMGILKDPMDKRMDLLLRRSWQSVMGSLKPSMATTCVARNLDYWVSQLKAHIVAGSPKQDILDTFATLSAAVTYIADASVEAIRMTARSAALVNSSRRALWLKTWPGDTASKSKLCGIPFTGDLIFGPELDAVLDRTADKKSFSS